MRRIRALMVRLFGVFSKERHERDLAEEIESHLQLHIADNLRAGMNPADARREALLKLGGVEQIKENCRDMRGRWLEDFAKDLRYAARTLRRSPGFLAVSVLSLALGIGANTAIFSLINTVMLQSLPVKEPERLVQIARVTADGKPLSISYPLFLYSRDNMKTISGTATQMESSPAIVIDGVEELVSAELVSGAHYSVLGVEPAAGRLLEPADDAIAPDSPAALVSHGYWQRR